MQMKIIDSILPLISILAAGKGWLAVDKPAGVSVHNATGRDICSVASAFIQREPAASGQMDMDLDFGVNPVHRLDKETSGIILLAVTPAAFRFFSKQFESRQVKKQYVTILHGRLETPQGNDPWGTWRWELAKTAGGRLSPEGAGKRQAAETRYRILERSAHYTMVEIEPLTGRRHQIRRHAKLAGHPWSVTPVTAPNGRQATSAGILRLTVSRCTRTRSSCGCRAQQRRKPSKPRLYQNRCGTCLIMTGEKRT